MLASGGDVEGSLSVDGEGEVGGRGEGLDDAVAEGVELEGSLSEEGSGEGGSEDEEGEEAGHCEERKQGRVGG